ncbi:FecR family protein [Pseudopedobacter beijingensis]|uniref:FecR family protein n=1 Tax=Pseudopedobacter beijingensis TaxID=1207056 RepID=A0ABW4IE72_9SPHI
MDEKQIREILKRYNEGSCSREEREWVESWYLDMVDKSQSADITDTEMLAAKDNIWQNIVKERPIGQNKGIRYSRIVAAASVIVIMGFAYYFFNSEVQLKNNTAIENYAAIIPGGNKAYLTLADGKKINLTDLDSGMTITQEGIKVIKKSNGELVYEITDAVASAAQETIGNNTIETPVGGQYQVLLPDGTKVWLNSSSSLQYPVKFSSNERRVTLTGEGYFEVKSDKTKPFKVVSENQTIEVLGTKFNVNTYKDEPAVRTTLLEGSVKVSLANETEILRPGEQSAIKGQQISIQKVDTEQAVAWYRGDFAFEGAELKNIMRQISRWYNVEVVYQGDVGDIKFGGSISRSKDIQEVLKVLSMTQGVNFKLEGRRVLVML